MQWLGDLEKSPSSIVYLEGKLQMELRHDEFSNKPADQAQESELPEVAVRRIGCHPAAGLNRRCVNPAALLKMAYDRA